MWTPDLETLGLWTPAGLHPTVATLERHDTDVEAMSSTDGTPGSHEPRREAIMWTGERCKVSTVTGHLFTSYGALPLFV